MPTALLLSAQVGLSLAGLGRYDEAQRIFAEARRLGEKYEIGPFHSRAVAASAGFHLDVFDFTGNQALAEEARELARSVGFPGAICATGVDLLLNFARRGDVARAQGLLPEATRAVDQNAGWHGWVMKMRLTEAEAEMALARADWVETVRLAGQTIDQARNKCRPKYEALGLWTRARALHALDRRSEAMGDLKSALILARQLGDPSMVLRVASELLRIEGNDALLSEARTAARKISAALPDEELRRHFQAAEPVRILGTLAP